jgi:hypothetical protein
VAGYREFQTGEVLTAANVNNFLMEQAVLTFPDAAARTAALAGVLREGILTYNEDTAQLEVYDGTAFVVAAPAPPAGIGSNVVQTVKTDVFTTTSATFGAVTGLSVTITPSSDTSKILIMAQVSHSLGLGTASNRGFGAFKVTRGGTDIYRGDADGSRTQAVFGGLSQSNQNNTLLSASIVFLDSPSVATAVTYDVEVRAIEGLTAINRSFSDANDFSNIRGASSITVIEVAV